MPRATSAAPPAPAAEPMLDLSPAAPARLVHTDHRPSEGPIVLVAVVRDFGGQVAWSPEADGDALVASGAGRYATARDLAIAGLGWPSEQPLTEGSDNAE